MFAENGNRRKSRDDKHVDYHAGAGKKIAMRNINPFNVK